jgi:hypothetical protein
VPRTVDFETFQRVLNRPGGFRDPGEPEEYCRGFQVFDKDMTGFIGVGQLKYILTNLGEKMTEDEVDELLKAVDTSSGQVNYTGKFFYGISSPSSLSSRADVLFLHQISSGPFSPTKRKLELRNKFAFAVGNGVVCFTLLEGPRFGIHGSQHDLAKDGLGDPCKEYWIGR